MRGVPGGQRSLPCVQMDLFMSGVDRRRALRTLAALAGAASPLGRGGIALAATSGASAQQKQGRRISQLIGTNGWATADSDVQMWRAMGISWGRDSVGPGQPNGPDDPMIIDKTGPRFDHDLIPALVSNQRNGINSLLILGYTPSWNATVSRDSKSAPVDVKAWERYVEAVVRKYSAPPYNLRYFQIWNEAAGKLSGGSQQATFWHGPDADGNPGRAKPYANAMQDYVERVHLPAARIIRRYHAYVVYGGWPDQGGLDHYKTWLEYRSPTSKERMIDWVDYLDTHYLSVHDLDPLYQQYVKNGPARGIWQTEIGDQFIKNPHYLPRYYFDFAVWALARNWDDPNKYVSMVYHWDGVESFRLTHRSPQKRTYNVSGQSLVVLNSTVNGALSSFSKPLQFDQGVSGSALMSDNDIVMQVSAEPGWQSVSVGQLQPQAARNARVQMIDALTGDASAPDDVTLAWSGDTLKLRFNVPQQVNGLTGDDRHGGGDHDRDRKGRTPRHLAYIVLRGLA